MNPERPDLRALARAAGLEIGVEEEAALERRWQGLLAWIAILEREEDVPPIEEANTQAGELREASPGTARPPAGRDPDLDDTLARETLRALAPQWVGDGFCVPRVRGKLP